MDRDDGEEVIRRPAKGTAGVRLAVDRSRATERESVFDDISKCWRELRKGKSNWKLLVDLSRRLEKPVEE